MHSPKNQNEQLGELRGIYQGVKMNSSKSPQEWFTDSLFQSQIHQ